MVHVFFSKSAERDLKRLPKAAETTIRKSIVELEANPQVGKFLHGPLRKFISYEFWASGVAYRIAYEIAGKDAVILMIDTRDNFYKKFSRRIR
jgi:mRNA-degrading endonuclease RelE of RelBE toxin-antitoxin system